MIQLSSPTTTLKFTNYNSYTGQGKVIAGNGSYATISHIGKSSISSGSHNFSINNLLYVPDIHKSLFSISEFTKDNQVFFKFHLSCCHVKDLMTHRVLLQGIEFNGLYQLLPMSSNEFAFTTSNNSAPSPFVSRPVAVDPVVLKSIVKITRWHLRLGHPFTDVLNHVLCACNISIHRTTVSSFVMPVHLGKCINYHLSLLHLFTLYHLN